MAEYLHTGDLGRFEGVLAALWTASFTIMGPEFINLIAAEAKRPRVHIKNAFKVIYWLPSVCGTSASHQRPPHHHDLLGWKYIHVLCEPKSIWPVLGQPCTKNGVPIYCVIVVMCFPLLSLLSLGNGSSQALTWLSNRITAGAIIDYIVVCVTYIFFYRACQAQSVDRKTFT
ncbi:unnamed protein product [Aspergillus oryzae RIB40]|uniref:DNA, SC103 n=1 Tax=Aspergillus oryzae (strain ATCC 42149 / RIB 40) TaxID=510516 RepID=Q2TYL9_ASPOR|nr:unnamed protein product [Aspergillus oryzae RIB40]BAE65654.1 unnamed protein product [Aspergillus oryzae RIB40]